VDLSLRDLKKKIKKWLKHLKQGLIYKNKYHLFG
jgi:hypothetical protein